MTTDLREPDERLVTAWRRASAAARARDRQMPPRVRAMEPGGSEWPKAWPDDAARYSPDDALLVIARNRHRFVSDEDFRLVQIIAEYYPWPFMGLETMAAELGVGVPRLRRRLAYLQRHGLLSRFYSPPSKIGAKDGRTLRLINLPGLHEEMVLCRLCEGCGKPLEPGARRDKRTHNDVCKKRASRAHKKAARLAAERASSNPQAGVEDVPFCPTPRPPLPDREVVPVEESKTLEPDVPF